MTKKNKIIIVSSAGGHLTEILELDLLRSRYEYLIVTEAVESTKNLDKIYNVKYIKPDVLNRGTLFYVNFLLNFFKALAILVKFRPDVILTTGSHTAVPICLLGKIFGMKIIWILSYARVSSKARSATFIYPISDLFLVQWESAQKLYPKSVYKGGIF